MENIRIGRDQLLILMENALQRVITDYHEIGFFQEEDLRASLYFHLRSLNHSYIYLETYYRIGFQEFYPDLRVAGDRKNQILIEIKFEYPEGNQSNSLLKLSTDIEKLKDYKDNLMPNELYTDALGYFIYFTDRKRNNRIISELIEFCDRNEIWKKKYLVVFIYSISLREIIFHKIY